MIEQDKRKAIYTLYVSGMSCREISRQLGVGRNTVTAIITQKGNMPEIPRKDRIEIDSELLCRLYAECSGWVQRIHEKLTEEEGIEVGYSTLTRKIRDLGLGQPKNDRCDRVPDKVGAEIQHDTSPYTVRIGEKQNHVQGSILYFRYSKVRYLKFYRSFNRFTMKCFLHEALTFYGFTAPVCIIDNTNLARLRGTGKNAVIVPEMKQFANQFGFKFVCHEIGHANRKAGEERSFFTVETNFFPGRSFKSLEDLNQQAFEWATVRMPNRPVSKTGLIPAKAFEYEKAFLIKLPPFVQPPYLILERGIDQYGYISFDGNFYWVPGKKRGDVTVLRYSNFIKIYQKRQLLLEYQLPSHGVKNILISPDGMPKPKYQPNNRKKSTQTEEKKLRAASEEVNAYLNFSLKSKGTKKHRFIRELFGLYKKIARSIFIKTVKRALKYRITDINSVERIAILQMNDGSYEMPLVEINEEFQKRETYLEGRFSDDVDLSIYDKLLEEEDKNE